MSSFSQKEDVIIRDERIYSRDFFAYILFFNLAEYSEPPTLPFSVFR